MRYIVVPTEDVQALFSADELEHARKSLDGSDMIVHEETLLRRREKLGLMTLPINQDGMTEWTYPVYEHDSPELGTLLASGEWAEKSSSARI